MTTLAASGPTALWYLARGSGIVTLILLTVVVVLGIVTSMRWHDDRWPRFVIEYIHRNASLLLVVFLGIHIATMVLDGYAPIGWLDAVVPLRSVYRPVWLGLGALGFDIVLALVITSLLRDRIGHRVWRVLHWLAYLAWPVAVLHGLGTGTDTKLGVVLVVNAVCVIAVLGALGWRLVAGWPDHAGARAAGIAVGVAAPIALVVWLSSGPLASGWARKAGTPEALLTRGASVSTSASAVGSGSSAGSSSTGSALSSGSNATSSFSASITGTASRSAADASGAVTLDLHTTLTGGATGTLDVRLRGRPSAGGSLLVDSATVTYRPAGGASYSGSVSSLRDDRLLAEVSNGAGGPIDLTIDVQVLDTTGGRVEGTVQGVPAGSAGSSDRSGADR